MEIILALALSYFIFKAVFNSDIVDTPYQDWLTQYENQEK